VAINWNGFLPQEPSWAVGAVSVCIVTLVGAGWGLFSFGYSRGKDIGQDELSAYKAVSSAKLPEITSGLLTVDKELRESLKVFDRNKTLETENASYQKQLAEAAKARAELDVMIKKLQGDFRDAEGREASLRNEIARLSGESRQFRLSENQSELLGEGHGVGLGGSRSMTSLNVTVDNKDYEMKAGNSVNIDLSLRACTLTLTSLRWANPTYGDFDWSCRNR
jgi:hypothetical protein